MLALHKSDGGREQTQRATPIATTSCARPACGVGCTYPFLHNVPNAAQLVPHLLNASTNAVQARDGCCRESRVRERASGEAQPAKWIADGWLNLSQHQLGQTVRDQQLNKGAFELVWAER
jgi:hypothetical protein